MIPFRGLSPRSQLALMGGGLLALVGAEFALLYWLSAHPPVPAAIPAPGASSPSGAAAPRATSGAASSTPAPFAKPASAPAEQLFTAPGVVPAGASGAHTSRPASSKSGGASALNPASGAGFAPPPVGELTATGPVTPGVAAPVAAGGAMAPAPNPQLVLAAQRFDQAGAALKRGDKRGALALWEQVARAAPTDLATRQNLALVYGELNQPKAALPHARVAVQLAPKNPAAQFQLARLLLADRQPQVALEPLRAVVRLAPQEREGHALLARVLVTLHQPKAALAQWAFLAQKNGRDLEAHLLAASVANDLLHNPTEAQKWLRRAQAQNPRDPQVPLVLSQLLLSRRDAKGATTVLKRAVQAAPDNFALYPALAQTLAIAKDRPGAIKALQSALSRVPKTAGAGPTEGRLRLTMGQLLGDGKQPEAAREQFSRAAKLLPRDPEPRALGALAELELRNPVGAAKLLGESVELDPKNARTRRLFAQTLAQSAQWTRADAQFETYCSRAPRDKEALAQWASVAGELKNPVRELLVWQKLGALDPKNPLVWEQLGDLQLRAGRKNEALKSFQKVTALAPRDMNTWLHVAGLQSDFNDPRAALATFERALDARPDYAPAYLLLLQAGDAAKQSEAARSFVAQKLALQARNGSALSGALKFYDDKKRPADARALLNAIIARNPGAALAQNALQSYGSSGAAPTATR